MPTRDTLEEERDYWLGMLRSVVNVLEHESFDWTDAGRLRWVKSQLRFMVEDNTPCEDETKSGS